MRSAILAVTVLAASATPALAFVDPAIALCELTTRQGRPEGAEIHHMESRIDGLRVLVSYSISILGTKPRERENICQFQYDTDIDRFVAAPIVSTAPADCSRRSDDYTAWEQRFFNGPQPPSAEVAAAWKKADSRMAECTDTKLDNDYERTRADVLDRLWRETGIYPIAPADTTLAAAPANVIAAPRGPTYDRAAAGYVTSSNDPAVLDYVVCLEAATRSMPGDDMPAKVNVASMICSGKAANFRSGEPGAWQIGEMILECGFRPGDASPDAGC